MADEYTIVVCQNSNIYVNLHTRTYGLPASVMAAVRLADDTGCVVNTTFKGILIQIPPGADPQSVVYKWRENYVRKVYPSQAMYLYTNSAEFTGMAFATITIWLALTLFAHLAIVYLTGFDDIASTALSVGLLTDRFIILAIEAGKRLPQEDLFS